MAHSIASSESFPLLNKCHKEAIYNITPTENISVYPSANATVKGVSTYIELINGNSITIEVLGYKGQNVKERPFVSAHNSSP